MIEERINATALSGLLSNPFLYPSTLAMHIWPEGANKWYPGRHLLLASAKIAHAVRRGNGRLIISMPPRHGKSRLVSETTVPWYLQEFPGKHVMLTCYNSDKAEEFGRKARDIIVNRPDLFSVRVRRDVSRVDHFETESGSEANFVGLNGGMTGKGAHLIIVDDYIKNIQEALSPKHREDQWIEFLANLDTRLEPGGTVIIVATRWHSDDLIGRVLKNLKGWEYICMPALATEKDDPLGRAIGEPLFPERYGLERLLEIKEARTGTFLFESLYQQRPIDDISQLTNRDWIKIIDGVPAELEAKMTRTRAWDLAATEGGGDWTTGTLMGRVPVNNNCIIFHVAHKQLSPANVEQLVRQTAEMDGTGVTVCIEQEPGSASKHLIEHYQRNVLPEFRVVAVPTSGLKKIVRWQPFIAAAEFGRVSMVRAPWNETFLEEYDAAPSAAHDDQLDTAAIAYNNLYQLTPTNIAWGQQNRDDVGYPASYSVPGVQNDGQQRAGSNLISGLTW